MESTPAIEGDRVYTIGVGGVLKVDPYVAGKWLVSLYILEEAELKVEGL